jgi:rare lipoprotein A (peptidoglycan hydrolase)
LRDSVELAVYRSASMTHLRIVIFTTITLAIVSCRTPAYQEQGWASYIADSYAGRMTSSGQVYHPGYSTAAHNTLPFGTEVTVKNLYNGRSVKAMVNDRFPSYPGRVVNLSGAAAQYIGMSQMQLSQVKVTADRIPQGGYSQPAYQQQPYPQQQVPQQTYAQQPYYPQQQAVSPQQSLVPNYPSQASTQQPVQNAAPAARTSIFKRLGGNSTPAAPAYQGGGGPPPGLNTF